MAVSPAVSRQYVQEELALVQDLAAAYHWDIHADLAQLLVSVTMYAHNGDRFMLEIRCDDYKEVPPFFEFIDPDSGAKGTPHAYPRGSDTFFHSPGLCICAPFSRKAYKSVVATGPHADWSLGDWMTSTANNVQWSNFSKLGDMLGLIQSRLNGSSTYLGRMG